LSKIWANLTKLGREVSKFVTILMKLYFVVTECINKIVYYLIENTLNRLYVKSSNFLF